MLAKTKNSLLFIMVFLATHNSFGDETKAIESVELRPPGTVESITEGLVTINDLAIEEPVDCIAHARLDSTEILSERYILFRMSRKEAYVNVLRRKCSALRPRRKLLLKPQGSRICKLDMVTVLSSDSFGSAQVLSRGNTLSLPGMSDVGSCGLGSFSKLTEDSIVVLKEQIAIEKKLERNRLKDERRRKKEQKKKKKEAKKNADS